MKRGTSKKQAERQTCSTSAALFHLSVCLSLLYINVLLFPSLTLPHPFQTLLHPSSHPPPVQTLLPSSLPSFPHLSPTLALVFCFLSRPLPKRLDEGLSTVMMCVSFTWQALACVLGVTKHAVSMGYNPVARCTQKHTLWT